MLPGGSKTIKQPSLAEIKELHLNIVEMEKNCSVAAVNVSEGSVFVIHCGYPHLRCTVWEHEPQGLRHRLGRVDLQIIWQKQVVLIYSG